MSERDEMSPWEVLIIEMLKKLTDEQRLTVFGHFCRFCGDKDPRCQCWNDE